ncbi:GDSL-like Lipase/Acylhydrolase family protein [Ruminococcus sp. YRD2003]|uniref:SGNH/GDSL hydrolase family protein n=1 Tax=Ruminococcus sp. YRD2003 TaxID=1452313 RepID=UPI0008AC4629|nr:GDSL-like Lipase/Acylhydrolase family protein [Ruminococcus flavefaciens]
MKSIPLDNNSVKLMGRALVRNDILYLTLSGTGCEFTFTGCRLVLTAGVDADCFNDGKRCNMPRIAVLCDGRVIVKKVIEQREEKFVIVSSDTPVTKTVRIVKLSECAFSLAELRPAETDDGAVIAPAPEKPMKIEFIGDSITCGYGVDDSNMQSDFSCEAENAMKSYAYISAELLGADYSLFSYSGYGLISGYSGDGLRNTTEILPPWYETCGFSYSSAGGVRLQDLQWDFSRFVPDFIVINLGTNDNSFCSCHNESYREFEDCYLDFLRVLRRNNPRAHIVCSLGIMLAEPLPYIESAIERFGDERVSVFRFTTQDGLLGFGSNWHPSEDTQLRAAEELAEYIKSIL